MWQGSRILARPRDTSSVAAAAAAWGLTNNDLSAATVGIPAQPPARTVQYLPPDSHPTAALKKIVDAATPEGSTPLHVAAAHGHLQIIRALASRGANVNAQDDEGLSPLHFAAEAGHMDVSLELVRRGANKALKDRRGRTAADLAEAGHTPHHMRIAEMLQNTVVVGLPTKM